MVGCLEMPVRILHTQDGQWVHLSYSQRTAKLRYWSNETMKQILNLHDGEDAEEFENLRNNAQSNFGVNEIQSCLSGKVDFDVHKLRYYRNGDEWLKATKTLKQMSDDGFDFGEAVENTPQHENVDTFNLIPQTELRRFYGTLNNILTGIKLATEMVNFLLRRNRSSRISKLINEGVRHFQRYENPNEPFAPGVEDRNHGIDAYLNNQHQFAKCLQARLRNARVRRQLVVRISDN
jgi:hypothetical protein